MTVEEALGLMEEIKNCSLPWDDAHWEALDIVINYVKDKLNNSDKSISEFDIQPQPKQEWSEEDKNHVKSILSTIEYCKVQFPNAQAVVEAYNADIAWLKNIKDRVQPQPKQEWSKEDRRHIEKLIFNVNAKECPDEVDWLISLHEKIAPPYWDKEDEEMLNQAIQEVEYSLNDKNIAFSGREPVLLWLKHLRPQSHWKPSKEQMDALKDVIENHVYDCRLEELLEQLKKLREE